MSGHLRQQRLDINTYKQPTGGKILFLGEIPINNLLGEKYYSLEKGGGLRK
jgi:hypothetical protein